ncbi:hypothetical protein [Cellulomonas sp. Y8]|uniref:hypothetical protein n=1 Tax=Cellulomonas sp. Y8 TaxID=2591145 RepID=UPI003D71E2AC
MRDSRYSDDPDLDVLLAASSPPTPAGDVLDQDAARAAVARARGWSRSGVRRLTGRRHALAVGSAVALGLAGVGAAAATQVDWRGWEEDPDVAFTFTLPSGARCEARLGGTIGADRDGVEQTRAFFREHDVLAEADVAGEIARMRADDDRWLVLDDGSTVLATYGTAHYPSPDQEYQLAVSVAVGDVYEEELARRGVAVAGGVYDGFAGAYSCPGADW